MKFSLVVAQGVHEGKVIPLIGSEFKIGRDPDCHLRPASPNISKKHCLVRVRDEKVYISDLGSTNGTFVNNEQIAGEIELKEGDRFRAGPLEFSLAVDNTASSNSEVSQSGQQKAIQSVSSASTLGSPPKDSSSESIKIPASTSATKPTPAVIKPQKTLSSENIVPSKSGTTSGTSPSSPSAPVVSPSAKLPINSSSPTPSKSPTANKGSSQKVSPTPAVAKSEAVSEADSLKETNKEPSVKSTVSSDETDAIAAMLLMEDTDTALSGEQTSEQSIPDGTTVMELPAIGNETPKKEEKKANPNNADTSGAAAAILSKYMRRPRT